MFGGSIDDTLEGDVLERVVGTAMRDIDGSTVKRGGDDGYNKSCRRGVLHCRACRRLSYYVRARSLATSVCNIIRSMLTLDDDRHDCPCSGYWPCLPFLHRTLRKHGEDTRLASSPP